MFSTFYKVALFSSELQGTPSYFILQYNIGVILYYKDVGITRKLYRTSCITDYIVNLCYKLNILCIFTRMNYSKISYVHKKYCSNWGPPLTERPNIAPKALSPITYKCMHVNQIVH